MEYQRLAERAISGEILTREEARAVLHAPDEEILEILGAAYRVRRTFCGNLVHLHVLMNAKSGYCPEDCGYCSQSSVSTAEIAKYPWVDADTLLEGAQRAKRARAKRFCIVASGRGPTWKEVDALCEVVGRIRAEVAIGICCSVGLLDVDKARALKAAGVGQLNHNLNTSERFTPQIVSTHTYRERVETLRAASAAGLNLCSGAIFGMGEGDDDIYDVLIALREFDPESIPINFLHNIQGTPLQDVRSLTPHQCLRILCLARLLNPTTELRVAGGRELHLGHLQPLALYPANSIFVEGYLTTPGQRTAEAWRMIEDLGFEIEEHGPVAAPQHS